MALNHPNKIIKYIKTDVIFLWDARFDNVQRLTIAHFPKEIKAFSWW